MIVKRHPARELLSAVKGRLGLDHVQIGEDAVFRLAQAMDAYALSLAAAAFEALGEDNENRRRLRLADLRRLTDRHVEEALDGDG